MEAVLQYRRITAKLGRTEHLRLHEIYRVSPAATAIRRSSHRPLCAKIPPSSASLRPGLNRGAFGAITVGSGSAPRAGRSIYPCIALTTSPVRSRGPGRFIFCLDRSPCRSSSAPHACRRGLSATVLTTLSGDDLLAYRTPALGVFVLGALLVSIPVLRLSAAVSIRRDQHCDPVTFVYHVRL